MTVEIRHVAADAVRPLRHAVLRQGAPLAESVYPVDDLPDTVHLGALDDGAVIGTATFFPEPYEGRAAWRLRGMAVAEERRGAGVGSLMLDEAVAEVRQNEADLLWCNARTVALPFYSRRGFTIVGEEFLVAHGVPHYLAVLKMTPNQA
ncbi:MAG: GNAT family N-acetyltransferase [Actinomycetia bacterium]|nr:GNAT family N-acetyltransferase [Actinomycetes bacterium]